MAYENHILLDRVVTLLEPNRPGIRDDWNNEIEIFSEPIEHEVWAMRRDLSARERISSGHGDQVLSSLRTRFTVRFRSDVAPTWRLRDGSEYFNVEGVRELGRRKYSELICSSHRGGA